MVTSTHSDTKSFGIVQSTLSFLSSLGPIPPCKHPLSAMLDRCEKLEGKAWHPPYTRLPSMFNVFLGLASLTIDLFAKHVVLGPELVGMIVLPAPANDRNENLETVAKRML